MSGCLGAIEGMVNAAAGDMGGGDFFGELMNVLESGMGQGSGTAASGGSSGGSSSTGSEIAQIAGAVLPIALAFL